MARPNEILADDVVLAVEMLAARFADRSVRYAIVGGIATSLRGRPRFTQEVYVLLDVPQPVLPGVLDDLANSGFSLDRTKVIREYVQDRITKFEFRGVRIDWMKPVLPVYSQALSEATLVPWTEGCEIRVADTVGLVVMKLIAFRPQDQLDIDTLLGANRGNIDIDAIRRAWSEISEDEDERTKWLEDAIARSLSV